MVDDLCSAQMLPEHPRNTERRRADEQPHRRGPESIGYEGIGEGSLPDSATWIHGDSAARHVGNSALGHAALPAARLLARSDCPFAILKWQAMTPRDT